MGVLTRETKEGCPAEWLVGSLGLSCQYNRFLFALAAPVGLVQNIFFSHLTLFKFLCPHRPASLAGRRAGSPIS
jgi:hypothetical protein